MNKISMILKESFKYQFYLFLVSPILALYNAFRSKSEKFIVFTGTLFTGFAGSLYVYIPGNDGATHLQNAKDFYTGMTLSEFFHKSLEIITLKSVSGAADMYIHIISFLSVSVIGIPELLHIIAGLVLGFFYTKSVLLVLKDRTKGKLSLLILAYIALFLIYRSLTALNSIRMWTAMWVLFYGSYSWVLTKKNKYLLIAFLSVFFHVSYLMIVLPLMLGYFLRKKKIIITGVYLLSFFYSVNFLSIQPYIPDLPLIQNKIKYNVKIDEDKYEDTSNSIKQNFYVKWGEKIFRNYSIVGLSFLLLYFYYKRNVSNELLFLFANGIILISFANFFEFSPAISGRTKTIASVFIIAAAIHQLFNISAGKQISKIQPLISLGFWAFIISSIPLIIFHISYIINTISIFIISLPVLSWIIGNDDVTIREFLGLII